MMVQPGTPPRRAPEDDEMLEIELGFDMAQHSAHVNRQDSPPLQKGPGISNTDRETDPFFSPLELAAHRGIILACVLTGLSYTTTRWASLIRGRTWAGLPFIASETSLLLAFAMAMYMLWTPRRRKGRDLRALLPSPALYPPVDVFIPTFNEPVDVVRGTTEAALQLDYPPDLLRVYVLDDGGNEAVRQMVERLRASQPKAGAPSLAYIARAKVPGVPNYAKAGNLNHALDLTTGRFIVVFDCDMMSHPSFLRRTIGHFYRDGEVDPTVGFVQTPQDFYNVHPRDPLNQRQRFFYDFVLPGWTGRDMSLCCGTNVAYSREALRAIGGWGVHSATEDVLTSYLMQASGLRGCYVHERLAYGLNPRDAKDFFDQRLRWAVGSLQILRGDPPLLKPGLGLRQRLAYIFAFGCYLQCLAVLILSCMPLVFLLSPRLVLFNMGVYAWLAAFLPYYLSVQAFTLFVVTRSGMGLQYFYKEQQEGIYLIFLYFRAILTVYMGIGTEFLPTPKDGGRVGSLWRRVAPGLPNLLFAMLVLGAGGWWGARMWVSGVVLTSEQALGVGMSVFWLVTNSVSMLTLPFEGVRGFGTEANRTFAEFVRARGGWALEVGAEGQLQGGKAPLQDHGHTPVCTPCSSHTCLELATQ